MSPSFFESSVFEVFCVHSKTKTRSPVFSNSSGLKSVFLMLHFRDGFSIADGRPNRRNKVQFSIFSGIKFTNCPACQIIFVKTVTLLAIVVSVRFFSIFHRYSCWGNVNRSVELLCTLSLENNTKIKNKIEILKHTLKSVKLISSVLTINQLTVNPIIFLSECLFRISKVIFEPCVESRRAVIKDDRS